MPDDKIAREIAEELVGGLGLGTNRVSQLEQVITRHLAAQEAERAEQLRQKSFTIAQCELCGEIFDQNSLEARAGLHTGVTTIVDVQGNPQPEPCQCGPISEREVVGFGEALTLLEVKDED